MNIKILFYSHIPPHAFHSEKDGKEMKVHLFMIINFIHTWGNFDRPIKVTPSVIKVTPSVIEVTPYLVI